MVFISHDWFIINHERRGFIINIRSNFNIDDRTFINNLFIPFARTTNYGLKQLKVNGPRIWNGLPNNIKSITSISLFLKKIKFHYISKYD